MNEAMKQLHQVAAFNAQQIRNSKRGWPKPRWWRRNCYSGYTMMGDKVSFIKLGMTGLLLGQDGLLYTREGDHHRTWGHYHDRPAERIEEVCTALGAIRLRF